MKNTTKDPRGFAKPDSGSEDVALLTRLGFRPAFLDFARMVIHLSRNLDGSAANFHCFEGLPDHAVSIRSPSGRVMALKPSLVAGYERNGYFYTRTTVARMAREWGSE